MIVRAWQRQLATTRLRERFAIDRANAQVGRTRPIP
jgi:hypothetical protein